MNRGCVGANQNTSFVTLRLQFKNLTHVQSLFYFHFMVLWLKMKLSPNLQLPPVVFVSHGVNLGISHHEETEFDCRNNDFVLNGTEPSLNSAILVNSGNLTNH